MTPSPKKQRTTAAAAGFWGRLVSGRMARSDFWLLLPPFFLFIYLINATRVYPSDFWWHLRTGQIIVQEQAIPNLDLFTFTRGGEPWLNQGWLMQTLLYLLYQAGGLPLIIFSHAALITLGYVLVETACLQVTGGHVRAVAGATMATALAGWSNWGVRPQTISFVLYGLLVCIVERHHTRSGRAILWLPLLFAAWANFHGGFAFGIALLGLYVLGEIIDDLRMQRHLRRQTWILAGAGVASILALALNPAGPLGIVRYVLGFFQSSATQNGNMEFNPLSLREVDGKLVTAYALLLLGSVYRRRITLRPYEVMAALAFGILTLYTRRVAPWFSIALAPTLARSLTAPAQPRHSGEATSGSNLLNYLLAGALLLACFASLPWAQSYLSANPAPRSLVVTNQTPLVAAREACALGPETRLYSHLAFASYMAWACPSVPLFIDTRFELYPSDVWADYHAVAAGRFDWEETLASHGVNAVMVHQEDELDLVRALRRAQAWELVYEDEQAALFRQVKADLAGPAVE